MIQCKTWKNGAQCRGKSLLLEAVNSQNAWIACIPMDCLHDGLHNSNGCQISKSNGQLTALGYQGGARTFEFGEAGGDGQRPSK